MADISRPPYSFFQPIRNQACTSLPWELSNTRATAPTWSWCRRGHSCMGLPENDFLAEDHEKPAAPGHLAAFWIDVYPVTQRSVCPVPGSGRLRAGTHWWTPEGWAWRSAQSSGAAAVGPGRLGRRPISRPPASSWYEADAYARWVGPALADRRRMGEGGPRQRRPALSLGQRLAQPRRWPTSTAASAAPRRSACIPAGVSPYGCHDMAGNVNNWTSDWYWPDFGRFCVAEQAAAQSAAA